MAEDTVMEWHNARYNASGSIDVNIMIDGVGWIPFTASEDDPEEYGRELFEQLRTIAYPYDDNSDAV